MSSNDTLRRNRAEEDSEDEFEPGPPARHRRVDPGERDEYEEWRRERRERGRKRRRGRDNEHSRRDELE